MALPKERRVRWKDTFSFSFLLSSFPVGFEPPWSLTSFVCDAECCVPYDSALNEFLLHEMRREFPIEKPWARVVELSLNERSRGALHSVRRCPLRAVVTERTSEISVSLLHGMNSPWSLLFHLPLFIFWP
jgi:hypothetical protein